MTGKMNVEVDEEKDLFRKRWQQLESADEANDVPIAIAVNILSECLMRFFGRIDLFLRYCL